MSDNVIKFRRPEKKPEAQTDKARRAMPGWLPFAGLMGLTLVIFVIQRVGLGG